MPRTVLVADDNLTMQRLAAEILSQEGLEVVTVANGMAAIRKIPDLKPLVVLADADMPGKDGYEVCDFIKTQPGLSYIRVLLAVSDADPYDNERGFHARVDGTIKKPFDREQLVSTVTKCLEEAETLNPQIAVETRKAPFPPLAPAAAPLITVSEPFEAFPSGTPQADAPVTDGASLPQPTSFPISQSTGAPEVAGETLNARLAGESEPQVSSRDGMSPNLADNVPAVFFDADPASWADPQPAAASPTSAGEFDRAGLPESSDPARQTLSSYEVVFLENDYDAGHLAAGNPPAEIPEEHTTPPVKLETEENNAGNLAQAFAPSEQAQNTFPGIGLSPGGPEPQINRALADGALVASIVRKVVSRMSPPALTAETVQDLEERLIREILAEIKTMPV
ncbi:MAG TPA: response regulator [Terriglobia bacterium]|nr:response regulator [Terriglobia bacterium]